MGGRERKEQVVNGFRLAGGLLLAFVLVGTLVAAVGVGVFGANPAPMSFSSRPLALAEAAGSLTLITLLVQRWAKYLGPCIAYTALRGLMVAISGHLVSNPAIPVRRSWALMMTGIAIFSALLCLRFTEDYELNLVDKMAVVGWLVCFAIALNVEKYGLTAMAVAAAGLLLAWFYDHLTMRHARHHAAIHVNLRRSR